MPLVRRLTSRANYRCHFWSFTQSIGGQEFNFERATEEATTAPKGQPKRDAASRMIYPLTRPQQNQAKLREGMKQFHLSFVIFSNQS